MNKLFISGVCLCVVPWMAMAQVQEATPAGFKTSLAVGMTLTDGNSETMQANGALLTEGEKEGLGSVRAGVEGKYGESTVDENKDTTVENVRTFANVKKTISPRTFGSVNGEVLYDDIAQIDYRATLGPAAGVYLVKNDKASLSVEAGPSYIWEETAGVRDDYLALRFAERADYALSKTSRLWQSAEYIPSADYVEDYLLNAEIGAEAAMNTRLNLRLVLQDKYDNTPGAALEKNDVTLVAGVSVTL